MEEFKAPKLTQSEALARIQAVMQEISTMGANDSEFASIQRIMEGVFGGTIEPEAGVLEAQGIRDAKMDYH